MNKRLRAFLELSLILSILIGMVSYASGIPRVQPAEVPPYAVKVIVNNRGGTDLGTGSIIRYDLVLTANHVVRDRQRGELIEVLFFTGRTKEARVIKTNANQDLALLRIKPTILPAVKISKEDPEVGDAVEIGGFARGINYRILYSKVQKWYWTDRTEQGTLFSVSGESISGMSGGPVIRHGKLVGILSASNFDESMCPNAERIQEFLRDFDLLKQIGE